MGRPSDFNKIWDLPEEEEKKEQQEYAYDEMSISEDEDVAEAYGTVRKQRRDSFSSEGESNRLLDDNEVDDLIHFAGQVQQERQSLGEQQRKRDQKLRKDQQRG